jgi:sensor histidine kinase regulating citrate/malate metabolism
MPSWEFCRVLGNLIDNAIYALQVNAEEKCIRIELFEDLKAYGFRIINNGPEIPEDIRGRIFDAGFTTKGEDGEGMGLSITRKLLSEAGGSISVISSTEETIFEGFIPR